MNSVTINENELIVKKQLPTDDNKGSIDTFFEHINHSLQSKIKTEEITFLLNESSVDTQKVKKERFHIEQIIFNVVFLVIFVYLAICSFK